MSNLTSEEKRRIEANRLKALEKRSGKAVHGLLPSPKKTQSNPLARPPQASLLAPHQFQNNGHQKPILQKAQNENQKIIGKISVISPTRCEVTIGYNAEVINAFKTIKSKSYNPVTKGWNFDIEDLPQLNKVCRSIPNVQINQIPSYVTNLLLKRNGPVLPESEEVDLSILGDDLLNALMPYQKQGILFGIRHNGRVLIADDMGLGKTVQAIGLSAFYVAEWPLLIAVPSSVKFVWKDQINKWLPNIGEDTIQVVETAQDPVQSTCRVLIISYDLLVKRKDEFQARRFRIAILDESHLIKASTAARTKAALQVLKPAKRVILLSGTPALSRPAELYTQLQAVRPDLFSNFKPFGERYCDPKPRAWGTDYSGSSNMTELQIVMEHIAMIRRIKKDVLDQLPSKMREVIILDPHAVKNSKDFSKAADKCQDSKHDKNAFRAALMRFFHETAKIKLHAVRCYISDLLESNKKFVVFAHHMEMLDAIEHLLNEEAVGYIRIDGSVTSEDRSKMIKQFARSDDCRVSLLSITAASTGIDMSAASLVVFAELFWNPGILVQAEDRCHRIGQRNCVIVQYLIAKSTSDDVVWDIVKHKLNILSKAGLSKDSFEETTVDKFAAKNQNLITDYIHPKANDYFADDIPAEVFAELAKLDNEAVVGPQDNSSESTITCAYDEDIAICGIADEDDDFVPKIAKSRRKF